MTVEVEVEEDDDENLPPRLRIARPVLREEFEDYLGEKVKEISRELEKSGYAEIEYSYNEDAVRDELSEREHHYQKEGLRAMSEYEFYEWMKSQGLACTGNSTE